MLSQDALTLAKSIRKMEKNVANLAQVLNCIAINMERLADSLQTIESNTTAVYSERPLYEDIK